MGCTSSAPNMVNSSTAEKSIQSDEETSDDHSKDTEEIIYRAGNTVLPSCDTITEHNIQVVRNRSTPSLKTEKENQEDGHKDNKTDSSDTRNEEESPPKLGQVVEKAVEFHSSENINETLPDSNKPNKTAEQSQRSQENKDNYTRESNVLEDNEEHSDVEQDKQKSMSIFEFRRLLGASSLTNAGCGENILHSPASPRTRDDHPEESISPSQSESSRATRWEALADIAAELPPTLTVDPLTGQIYAVSK